MCQMCEEQRYFSGLIAQAGATRAPTAPAPKPQETAGGKGSTAAPSTLAAKPASP